MKKSSKAHGGNGGHGKYTSIPTSEILVKSTSEEDFSNRESCASAASPAYLSDRSSTAGNNQYSITSDSSSPFAMSPWNNNTSSSPWNTNPFAEDGSNAGSSSIDSATNSLFPPGTGLIGSLVREEGHIYSLAAFGDLLYTGSDSKNIRVWKNQKDYSGFKSTSGLVKAIVISRDHRVFTGHQDGKIRVWRVSPKNPKVHKRVGTLPRLKDFLKSSMNPSNYVESRRNKSAVWIRHSDAISTLTLSEDQTLLYSGSWDRTLKVWRLADSKCLESVNAHDDAVNAVVNGFDSMVFTGSADGTVKVWKREAAPKGATRHVEVRTLLKQESAVTALAINRSTGVVYSGSSDGVVNLWEKGLTHGGVLHGHKLAVMCLASAGSLLFSGSADKTICLWGREATGAHICLSVLTGHGGPVKCLAVEADPSSYAGPGKMWLLYSGSLDKSVKVWKVCDGASQQRGEVGSDDSSSAPPKFDVY